LKKNEEQFEYYLDFSSDASLKLTLYLILVQNLQFWTWTLSIF